MHLESLPDNPDLAKVAYSSVQEAELVVGRMRGWFKKSLEYLSFNSDDRTVINYANLEKQEDGTLTGTESMTNLAKADQALARWSYARFGRSSLFGADISSDRFMGEQHGEQAQDLHATISVFLDTRLPSKTMSEHEAEMNENNKKDWIRHLDPVREDSVDKWYKAEGHRVREAMYETVGKIFKMTKLSAIAGSTLFAAGIVYQHASGNTTPLEHAASNVLWDTLQVIGWSFIGSIAFGVGTGLTTTAIDTTRRRGYIRGNKDRFAEFDPDGEKLAELRARLIQERFPDKSEAQDAPSLSEIE